MNKDIVKEYGDVLHDPASITERPLKVLSVGPKIRYGTWWWSS